MELTPEQQKIIDELGELQKELDAATAPLRGYKIFLADGYIGHTLTRSEIESVFGLDKLRK